MLVFPRKLFRKLIPFRLLCCLIDCCSLSCALLVSAAVSCFRRYSAVHASFFPCVCPPPFLPFQANLICRSKNIKSQQSHAKILMAVLAVLAVSLTINHLRACIDHIFVLNYANYVNCAMSFFFFLLPTQLAKLWREEPRQLCALCRHAASGSTICRRRTLVVRYIFLNGPLSIIEGNTCPNASPTQVYYY